DDAGVVVGDDAKDEALDLGPTADIVVEALEDQDVITDALGQHIGSRPDASKSGLAQGRAGRGTGTQLGVGLDLAARDDAGRQVEEEGGVGGLELEDYGVRIKNFDVIDLGHLA